MVYYFCAGLRLSENNSLDRVPGAFFGYVTVGFGRKEWGALKKAMHHSS